MCLGIPGQVLGIADDEGLAMGTVDFGGVRKQVCLAYVPEIRPGEYVIVHVGFAIARVDEQEARRTLDVLRAMGDAVEAELGEPIPRPVCGGPARRGRVDGGSVDGGSVDGPVGSPP